MIKSYARIYEGIVSEILTTDGDINEMFHPDLVWVDVSDLSPEPEFGWTAARSGDAWTIAAPAPSAPTPEEALRENTQVRSDLETSASQAMTPLLLSLQLGDATAEETASAKAWQAYVRALKAVDLTVTDPAWPVVPA